MAKHLDLEEQEQLDQLKHFWRTYGNLITAVIVIVCVGFAAFTGWQWWERRQSTQAAALYDAVERAAAGGDAAQLERVLGDIKDRFGGTAYGQQAALLAARAFHEAGKNDQAHAALTWVADKSRDRGYVSIARLRLAGLQIEAKAYDDAIKTLASDIAPEFEALATDRRGDIYAAQGKAAEAKAEYLKAYKAMDERADYRRIVEVKLNALGVDPAAGASAAATSGTAPAASAASAAAPAASEGKK